MSAAGATYGLLPLHALGRADRDDVGTKAATLGELARAGFPVPEGLVVPVPLLADDSLSAALDVALAKLGGGPVAVRSSAIAEDLAEASFAGQYDTVLDVADAEVLHAAVRTVATSAATERVDAYRRSHGVAAPSSVAVLIQRQVPADVAGAALTANPVTGARDEVLVSAVAGPGDPLMSGQADGEEWTVRDGEATSRGPAAVLTERQARAVAVLARRVEAHLEAPQDVEWAFADGRLQLLQARPMTALPDAVTWEAPARGGWARNFRLGEWLSDPVTPLFESWLLTRLEQVQFRRYQEMAGAVPPQPTHVVVNGWYFYTMNWLPETPGQMLDDLRHWLPKLVRRPRQAVMKFPGLARFGVGQALAQWRTELLPAYRRAVEAAEVRVDRAPPEELVAIVDQLADQAGDQFTSLTLVGGYAWKAELALAGFHERHVAPSVGFGHQRLLRGLGSPPPAHTVVASLDWFHPPLPPPDRAWGERPREVTADRRAAEDTARQALAGRPRRARRFESLLETAQRFARIREEQVDAFTAAWPAMRAAVLRLGDYLAESGRLARSDDVFFLTREQLEDLLRDHTVASGTPAQRRLTWQRQRRLVPPLLLGEFGSMASPRMRAIFQAVQPAWRQAGPVENAVAGVPASPGRATGPVCLVHDLADFERVAPGDVVVARAATPAFTPLFAHAAAVVTDVGSVTAHASLVVREYGIPCVVGCGDATATLRDGQVVTVDGSAGYVFTT